MHECEHCGCSGALSVQVLTVLLEIKLRLEQHMTQESDALDALSAKVDLLIADVRAALAAIQQDPGTLGPDGQAALDALTAKVDAFGAEVGDADQDGQVA
jgi:hypothetical protein